MLIRILTVGTILVVLIALAVWFGGREVPLPGPGPGDRPNNGSAAAPGDPSAEPGLAIGPPCPPFTLADVAGVPVTPTRLLGRAWIAQVVDLDQPFADHAALQRLRELEQRLDASPLGTDVVLVTFCRTKQPDVAAAVAQASASQAANSERWLFVAAGVAEIPQVLQDAEQLPGVDETRRLTLVDPQGHRRQIYDAASPECLATLQRDLQAVVDERVLIVENNIEPPFLVQALIRPPWVASRRDAQLKRAEQLEIPHDFQFEDHRLTSGIDFRHRIVDDAGRALVTAHYDHGTGISLADVDGDGLYDLYFVNQVGANRLYKNLGQGKFTDITEQAGVALADRISVAAAFADTDNDGDSDLFVTNVRSGNVLFLNDGQGKFTDVSEAAGLNYRGHSSSAEFFDFDRDGLLDLFLVNVGIYTTDRVAQVVNDRVTGPDQDTYEYYVSNADAFAAHLKPERVESSILYRNTGQNRFVDVSQQMNLVDTNWTGDATPLDANEDGWIDLYLVNMQGHDEYYENIEGQRFERKGRALFPATPWGTMGVKSFDFDNDGHLDLFLTDMHTDMAKDVSPGAEKEKIPKDAMDPSLLATDGNHVWGNAFFRNLGGGKFEEISEAIHAENYWPWGLSVGDLNADGFDDAVLTSSMNFPFRYGVNTVLLNDRGRDFVDAEYILGVEPRAGGQSAQPWFELDTARKDRNHPISLQLRTQGRKVQRAVVWGAVGSRSSVVFDLDQDGDLDIVTNEFNSPPQVLLSNLADTHPELRYVAIRLHGTGSNKDGLGSRVRLTAGGQTYTKVYDGQSGYLSQSSYPLYFGLGTAESIERLEVQWPTGTWQQVELPLATNKVLDIVEP